MVIVTTTYSFDSTVMARIFDDETTASEFIRRDYLNEKKISETENNYEEIIESECYCEEYGAKMVYYSYDTEEYIKWDIADTHDLRGKTIEKVFPSLKDVD